MIDLEKFDGIPSCAGAIEQLLTKTQTWVIKFQHASNQQYEFY